MEKIAVLFNPSSGRGLALKKKEFIKSMLKKNSLSFHWFESASETHLKQLAKEKAGSFEVLMVVGGDTSFQITASEVHKTPYDPALCMIPTGSANDVAFSLGNRSIESIIKSLKKAKTHQMDICLLETKKNPKKTFFVGSLSLGLGATINQFISQYWKRHPIQAKLGKSFQTLAGFLGARYSFKKNKIPMRLNLSSENFQKNCKFSIMVFSNVPSYAGGLRVCPFASPFDGKINCSIVYTKSLIHTTRVAYSVWKQKHLHKKEIQFVSGKSFSGCSDQPINIQYDGKIIHGVKEFKVSVIPSALKILE